MSTPTRDMFNAFLDSYRRLDSELNELNQFSSVPTFEDYVSAAEKVLSQTREELSNTDFSRWLHDQPTFVVAGQKIGFKTLSAKEHRERLELRARATFEAAVQDVNKGRWGREVSAYNYSFRNTVGITTHSKWLYGICSNLASYYFDDLPSRAVATKRKINKALQDLDSALLAYWELSADPFFNAKYGASATGINVSKLRPESSKPQQSRSDLLRLRRALIASRNAMGAKALHPISKRDNTAKLRTFVAAMSEVHLDLFYWPKGGQINLYPEAIYDLLYLDGIETRIDIRNVQRICTEHKTRRKTLLKIDPNWRCVGDGSVSDNEEEKLMIELRRLEQDFYQV